MKSLTLFIAASAATLIACSPVDEALNSQSPVAAPVVFEGYADIPVFEGLKKAQDCKVDAIFPAETFETGCVLGPLSDAARAGEDDPYRADISARYIKALQTAGWENMSVSGNILTMTRVGYGGCRQEMGLMDWLDGEWTTVATALKDGDISAFENFKIVFVKPNDIACLAPQDAVDATTDTAAPSGTTP